jgi:hypothetical protein
LAHTQLIGIGVLLSAQHFAHNYATENTGSRRDAIDLETRHRQARHQLITGYLRAYPATQPLFTELHPALLKQFGYGRAALAKLRQESQVVIEEQA